MKKSSLLLLGAAMVLGVLAQGMSFPPRWMPVRPGSAGFSLDARLAHPYISSHGGSTCLYVSIGAPDLCGGKRMPLNVAFVLDRSGSMREQGKIEHAKAAINTLIDRMDSEDILSIVIYDDEVNVLRPARRVGDREDIRRLVASVTPRGWTNLGGGMEEGFRELRRNVRRDCVNRVILLSDGLANQGITDPATLNRVACSMRECGMSLTTVGVGLEYNENLMLSLASSGGGNYYFIESSRNLAGVLRGEFNALADVVAQNAVLVLTPGAGVRISAPVGYEMKREGNRVIVPFGDLSANERRELVMEVSIPPGEQEYVVVCGKLEWDGGSVDASRPAMFSTLVHYTRSAEVVEHHRDRETQSKADIVLSTRAVDRAMAALDGGRKDEAIMEIAKAKEALAASPAALQSDSTGMANRRQQERLVGYSRMLEDKGTSDQKAKKAIQFENYNVQKSK